MFDCHFCGKSFGNKAGLTQHCKGKKHRENMDTFETAAQRQQLASDASSAIEATQAANIAVEAEALQQFQERVASKRAARIM